MRSDRYAPRVAGAAFLLLIAIDLAAGALWPGGTGDVLTRVSEHATAVRWGLVLAIAAGIVTLVLAAMLYAIVAPQDRNLAILALSCRAVEAGLAVIGVLNTLALLALSDGAATAQANALADLLVRLRPVGGNVGAVFFAAGSTVYCYLLLKARSIPVLLSASGLLGSLLVLVGVPLQTAFGHNTFSGPAALIWLPVAVFEIGGGTWLVVKGAKVTENR